MARRSFIVTQDHQFSWIADAERGPSELGNEGFEGPWIQVFKTQEFANDEAAGTILSKHLPWHIANTTKPVLLPIVGWISYKGDYCIAMASDHAYQIGIRWAPCLHSDPRMVLPDGNELYEFRSVVYVLEPNTDMLMDMFELDFPEYSSFIMDSESQFLWPARYGILLDPMEGKSPGLWSAESGSISHYQSMDDLKWVFRYAKGPEVPEGIFEGGGSLFWETPSGMERATLSRSISTENLGDKEYTHIGLEMVNRGSTAVDVHMTIQQDDRVISDKTITLHYRANRRLMAALNGFTPGERLEIALEVRTVNKPVRIVLDNLRIF
jgi:hypothetical protein